MSYTREQIEDSMRMLEAGLVDVDGAAMLRQLLVENGALNVCLGMLERAAEDMRGEDFNLTVEQWAEYHASRRIASLRVAAEMGRAM